MTTVLPQPRNLMSVYGTGLNTHDAFDTNKENNINDIIKQLEKFEISYGDQSGGIVSYGDNSRYGNNDSDFDEPTQHLDVNQNEDENDNEDDNENDNEDELSEDDNNKIKDELLEKDYYNIVEPFNGSQIIQNDEMIIAIKSLCVGILFVLISHSFVDKYVLLISKYVYNVSPVIIKSIIFAIMFYLTDKYLL